MWMSSVRSVVINTPNLNGRKMERWKKKTAPVIFHGSMSLHLKLLQEETTKHALETLPALKMVTACPSLVMIMAGTRLSMTLPKYTKEVHGQTVLTGFLRAHAAICRVTCHRIRSVSV